MHPLKNTYKACWLFNYWRSVYFQLKVREHPVLGPYVEGLSTYVVNSFEDVEVNYLLIVRPPDTLFWDYVKNIKKKLFKKCSLSISIVYFHFLNCKITKKTKCYKYHLIIVLPSNTWFDFCQGWITLGNKNRATAATGMNDKSSRSHSVFTLVLTQTRVGVATFVSNLRMDCG